MWLLFGRRFKKGVAFMKKLIALFALSGLFLIPAQGAFAWTYDGINSLNPFTGFRNCNKCERIKKQKCHKVKKVKCNSCARMKVLPKCNHCQKAFNNNYIYPNYRLDY